jgi:hypothetical protein
MERLGSWSRRCFDDSAKDDRIDWVLPVLCRANQGLRGHVSGGEQYSFVLRRDRISTQLLTACSASGSARLERRLSHSPWRTHPNGESDSKVRQDKSWPSNIQCPDYYYGPGRFDKDVSRFFG